MKRSHWRVWFGEPEEWADLRRLIAAAPRTAWWLLIVAAPLAIAAVGYVTIARVLGLRGDSLTVVVSFFWLMAAVLGSLFTLEARASGNDSAGPSAATLRSWFGAGKALVLAQPASAVIHHLLPATDTGTWFLRLGGDLVVLFLAFSIAWRRPRADMATD